jgi:SAM-dependent methyltransferase
MHTMTDVDVQRIVGQIREKLGRRRSENGVPTAAPVEIDSQLATDLSGLFSLSDPSQVQLSSHRKVFGRFVLWLKRVLRQLLTPILVRQTGYNATNARVVSRLHEHLVSLAMQQAQLRDELLAAQQDAVQNLREQIVAVQAANENAVDVAEFKRAQAELDSQQTLQTLQTELQTLRVGLHTLGAELQTLRGDVATAVDSYVRTPRDTPVDVRALERRHDESLRDMRERMAGTEGRLRRLVAALTHGEPEPPAAIERTAPFAFPLAPGFDSLRFGERFWGSEAEVRERRRPYVEIFRGREDVVDLGSGRGEFLDLLAEAGVMARGVDTDLDMILRCREKGLDVVQEDVFAHLASRPDASLGGIFAAQIVEHFESGQVFELMQLCHRKLRRGGALVIETPNPNCLMIFAQCFYMDFSHIRPIHPEALKFLADSVGFQEVELKFTSPVDPSLHLPRLDDPQLHGGQGEQWNRSLDYVNQLLFGFQDYAVIARR